jgi:hypothetical protein
MNRHTRGKDIGYCLLGIFDVNMPMLYGESDKSSFRLQEGIIKRSNDYTLFAWTGLEDSQTHSGILAQSPAQFTQLNHIVLRSDPRFNPEATITNKALRFLEVMGELDGVYVLPLNCMREGKQLGIYMKQHGRFSLPGTSRRSSLPSTPADPKSPMSPRRSL